MLTTATFEESLRLLFSLESLAVVLFVLLIVAIFDFNESMKRADEASPSDNNDHS